MLWVWFNHCWPLPPQIMSLVGDEVLEDVDNSDSEAPPPVPRSYDYGDEAPPIPAHTMASMELVEPLPPIKPSPGGGPKAESPSEALLSTYDVVGAVTETEIVYEQPEAPKAPRCKYQCTDTCMYMYMHMYMYNDRYGT